MVDSNGTDHATSDRVKRVLVKFGDCNRPITFSSDGGSDQQILEQKIRKAYRDEIPENAPIILQIKDEEWCREFVDVDPSATDVATKSILRVILKKVRGAFILNFNLHSYLYYRVVVCHLLVCLLLINHAVQYLNSHPPPLQMKLPLALRYLCVCMCVCVCVCIKPRYACAARA